MKNSQILVHNINCNTHVHTHAPPSNKHTDTTVTMVSTSGLTGLNRTLASTLPVHSYTVNTCIHGWHTFDIDENTVTQNFLAQTFCELWYVHVYYVCVY